MKFCMARFKYAYDDNFYGVKMKGVKTESAGGGPMSSAGLMRFFDVTGGGPKISPMVVVGACIGFILFELIINILF